MMFQSGLLHYSPNYITQTTKTPLLWDSRQIRFFIAWLQILFMKKYITLSLLFMLSILLKHEAGAQITKRAVLAEMGTKYTQTISEEEIKKLNDLMAPVKEKLSAIFKDDASGRFSAYQKDVKKLNSMKSNKERDVFAKQVTERYNGFMAETWAKAGINEKEYQGQILKTLSHINPATVTFLPFLVFYYYQVPPAAPAPERPLACLDVCPNAIGKVDGDAALISSGGGSATNCNLRASAWSAVVGGNHLYTSLANNISIPGTFPADNRSLHFKKSYDVNISATAFAVLGVNVSDATLFTYKTIRGLTVVAPVIFGASKILSERIVEDYTLSKTDVAKSRFSLSANTISYLVLSAGWSEITCSGISWTVCEEK
jgi:hypothetical protein